MNPRLLPVLALHLFALLGAAQISLCAADSAASVFRAPPPACYPHVM
ncbi:MAG: hypothetical protein MUE42_04340 [Opitutaceae bacterium]|nr:hypothetical protein [Opitutaceae bacterium]